MYRGFDLKLDLEENEVFWDYYRKGLDLFEECATNIETTLDSFIYPDYSLDGSKMQEVWFPQIRADVFISHSHKNKDLALMLAGWFSEKFGIKVFIDSCIWGYSKNLLENIDRIYSWSDSRKLTFDYDKVAFSSSHIHMMLANALTMMIDKTECLLFLNTPDSIKPYHKTNKTESPWIYSEITLSKLLRENIPIRHRALHERYSGFDGMEHLEEKVLKIKYNLDLSHLKKLNFDDLFNNLGKKQYSDKYKALDALYAI